MPEVTVRQWAGIFGPPKLPREIVERLNKEVNAALKRPDVIEKLLSYGYSPEGSTPERPVETNARGPGAVAPAGTRRPASRWNESSRSHRQRAGALAVSVAEAQQRGAIRLSMPSGRALGGLVRPAQARFEPQCVHQRHVRCPDTRRAANRREGAPAPELERVRQRAREMRE